MLLQFWQCFSPDPPLHPLCQTRRGREHSSGRTRELSVVLTSGPAPSPSEPIPTSLRVAWLPPAPQSQAVQLTSCEVFLTVSPLPRLGGRFFRAAVLVFGQAAEPRLRGEWVRALAGKVRGAGGRKPFFWGPLPAEWRSQDPSEIVALVFCLLLRTSGKRQRKLTLPQPLTHVYWGSFQGEAASVKPTF